MKILISHIKECFGFVPVAEIWEEMKSEHWDFLIIIILGTALWFYIAIEMVERW